MSKPVTQEYLDQSIGALEARLDAKLNVKIDEVLEVVQVGFTELRGEMNVRFDHLGHRVEVLEKKSDRHTKCSGARSTSSIGRGAT